MRRTMNGHHRTNSEQIQNEFRTVGWKPLKSDGRSSSAKLGKEKLGTSPKRGAGAGVGVGMLRGVRELLNWK